MKAASSGAGDRKSLASSTAQRQSAQLTWSIAGAIILPISYGVAQCLIWADLATQQFAHTVLWCAIPYWVAAHLIYKGSSVPASERINLLVVTTLAPFLLLMLGFALMQQAYSRGAVLLVYVLSTIWFVYGDHRRKRQYIHRLAYLDPEVPALIGRWCSQSQLSRNGIELTPFSFGAPFDAQARTYEGVVLNPRAIGDTARGYLLGKLKLHHIRIYSVESVAEMLSGRKVIPTSHDDLWQLDGNPAYDLIKRAADTLVILFFAPLWLPLCIVIGMVIKLDSSGPVLFSQARTGRNGHPFRMWKFRSMRHQSSETAAKFAAVQDERITRIGSYLRRWRFDELPQFINVLMGHMSLIGPRPEQTEFVDAFATRIPAYTYRHLVRPGLTGWAQVQQGYADSEDSSAVKLSYDLYYVANYSISLDLLITLKTLRIIMSGFGAR